MIPSLVVKVMIKFLVVMGVMRSKEMQVMTSSLVIVMQENQILPKIQINLRFIPSNPFLKLMIL